jgi:DNA mismatch repair ATPase MutS
VNGKNYHFEEFYQHDQIGFDYKLKAGKCQTTNAKHILKMAGII